LSYYKKSSLFLIILLFLIVDIYALKFTDMSVISGMQIKNYTKVSDKKIQINDHSRIRSADINGDGYYDLIMCSLFPNPLKGIPFENLVFLNNGDGTFTDFSEASGLKEIQAGLLFFADFDNDGDQDVFAGLDIPLEAVENNQIFENDGNGVFKKKFNSGVELEKNHFTSHVLSADFDNDGILDLFVGNGSTMRGVKDLIYKGNGDLTFTLIPDALKDAKAQPSNGGVILDYDNDGDQDIYVTTYGVSLKRGNNQLWENQGNMRFVDVSDQKGVKALRTGNRFQKSTGFGRYFQKEELEKGIVGSNGFGAAITDINRDGLPDILTACISHPSEKIFSRKWSDPSSVFINRGDRGAFRFQNENIKRGLTFNEGDIDISCADMDNDGITDIMISREDKYEKRYKEERHKGWFGVFKGKENGTFEDISLICGVNINDKDGTKRMKRAQNHSIIDYDLDGRLDLFIGGRDKGKGRPNYLFKNITTNKNGVIVLTLKGDGEKVNRDAIGAVVFISDEDNRIISRYVYSSRGNYSAQDTRDLYFGFVSSRPEKALLRWPDGREEIINIPKTGKFFTINYPNQIAINVKR